MSSCRQEKREILLQRTSRKESVKFFLVKHESDMPKKILLKNSRLHQKSKRLNHSTVLLGRNRSIHANKSLSTSHSVSPKTFSEPVVTAPVEAAFAYLINSYMRKHVGEIRSEPLSPERTFYGLSKYTIPSKKISHKPKLIFKVSVLQQKFVFR